MLFQGDSTFARDLSNEISGMMGATIEQDFEESKASSSVDILQEFAN